MIPKNGSLFKQIIRDSFCEYGVFALKKGVVENLICESCLIWLILLYLRAYIGVGVLAVFRSEACCMRVILDCERIERILDDLAGQILAQTPGELDIAVIGIRSRGEILAQRLSNRLSKKLPKDVPCGTLDITLYRDDLNSPQSSAQPQVRTTEIGFSIDDKIIVLVDDVLYTGRSARAAMDALIDLGRPRAIKLAVLVDRAGREFPIQADFAGYKTDAAPGKVVQVNLVESDGKDEVVVE
jgi:pyrimidine operon attenuation protein/uracil phosphoribosyltransferase